MNNASMVGQMNRFFADSYSPSTFQLGNNDTQQKAFINLNAKIFTLYENSKFVTLTSITPGLEIVLSKTLGL